MFCEITLGRRDIREDSGLESGYTGQGIASIGESYESAAALGHLNRALHPLDSLETIRKSSHTAGQLSKVGASCSLS